MGCLCFGVVIFYIMVCRILCRSWGMIIGSVFGDLVLFLVFWFGMLDCDCKICGGYVLEVMELRFGLDYWGIVESYSYSVGYSNWWFGVGVDFGFGLGGFCIWFCGDFCEVI